MPHGLAMAILLPKHLLSPENKETNMASLDLEVSRTSGEDSDHMSVSLFRGFVSAEQILSGFIGPLGTQKVRLRRFCTEDP